MPILDEKHNRSRAIRIDLVVRVKKQVRTFGVANDPVEMVDQPIVVLFGQVDRPDSVYQRLEFRFGVILESCFKFHLWFFLLSVTKIPAGRRYLLSRHEQIPSYLLFKTMKLLRFEAGFIVEFAPFFDLSQDAFGAIFLAFLGVEDDV